MKVANNSATSIRVRTYTSQSGSSIISDNYIENYNYAGIFLNGSSYCNITGNILKDTGWGIYSEKAETQYNKVSNNYILRGTGTSADYPSGKYTIYIVAGTYNYFSDNYIPGKNYVNKIKNAGAIFIGHYSPEALGDYMAGPNHVLPTVGTSRFFSPLGVDDFIKKSSLIQFTKESANMLISDVDTFAMAEGLEMHALSARVRGEE